MIVGNSDGVAGKLNDDIFKSVSLNSGAFVMFEGELKDMNSNQPNPNWTNGYSFYIWNSMC